MRHSILVLTTILMGGTSLYANAQSEKDQVRHVIDQLFDGMRAADSSMVGSVMHKEALMARVNIQGLSIESTDHFIEAVGTPHDEVWDERIWNVQIFIDGNLASAWMEYVFFLGDQMSHCGVNSMQLYLTDQGWKIIYLADTYRPPTCEPADSSF